MATCMLLVAACEEHTVAPGRGTGASARPAEGNYGEATQRVDFEPPRRRRTDDEAPAEPAAPPPPPPQPAPPPPPPRDLSAELAAAVGDPSGCLANLPQTARTASVSISAVVFEDGVVSSVHATVSPGDEASNRCVQRQAESAHLRGEVPDAPRPVTARIDVRR